MEERAEQVETLRQRVTELRDGFEQTEKELLDENRELRQRLDNEAGLRRAQNEQNKVSEQSRNDQKLLNDQKLKDELANART